MEKSDKISKSRAEAILKLISENKISRQDILQEHLSRLGYSVTQSTVSRDIKKLGIIKAPDADGIVRYMKSDVKFNDKSIFAAGVTDADYAGHTAVIKCKAGTAQAVCAIIDSINYPDVVGTIAGDDTIFLLMRSENDARHIVKKIKKELQLD